MAGCACPWTIERTRCGSPSTRCRRHRGPARRRRLEIDRQGSRSWWTNATPPLSDSQARDTSPRSPVFGRSVPPVRAPATPRRARDPPGPDCGLGIAHLLAGEDSTLVDSLRASLALARARPGAPSRPARCAGASGPTRVAITLTGSVGDWCIGNTVVSKPQRQVRLPGSPVAAEKAISQQTRRFCWRFATLANSA